MFSKMASCFQLCRRHHFRIRPEKGVKEMPESESNKFASRSPHPCSPLHLFCWQTPLRSSLRFKVRDGQDKNEVVPFGASKHDLQSSLPLLNPMKDLIIVEIVNRPRLGAYLWLDFREPEVIFEARVWGSSEI